MAGDRVGGVAAGVCSTGFLVSYEDFVPDHEPPMERGWLGAQGERSPLVGVGPRLGLDAVIRLIARAEGYSVVGGHLVARDVEAGRDDAARIQQTRRVRVIGGGRLPAVLVAMTG